MRTGRSRLFVCVLLIAAVIAGAVSVVKENLSKEADCAAQLSSHIIRFHVRANSDSDRDQQLKINVKEKVVQYIEPLLKDSCSIDESREILKENIPEIKEAALKQLKSDGSDDSVDVYFEKSYFLPTVQIKDEKKGYSAHVYCCYITVDDELVREHVVMKVLDGKIISYKLADKEVYIWCDIVVDNNPLPF